MAKNLRPLLCIGAFAVASVLAMPAQQQQYPQDRQDQVRHDQDDQNRQINQDQDRVRRDDQYPERDRDRDRASNTGAYGDQRWINSKAYKQGLKDGEHDRSKNKSQHAHERRWKNDQDRQAYEAGYNAGFGGNTMRDHDRDDQRRR